MEPGFEHHADLPVVTGPGFAAKVILGELDGTLSPGTVHSPVTGADIALNEGADVRLPVEPDFEYAALTMSGIVEVDGERVEPGSMLYLGAGRDELPLRAADGSGGLVLLGGEPFDEQLVIWWNFVARSGEEIAQARADWVSGDRFGEVRGFDGDPVPAPPLPATPLKARGRTR
jgi:redox-sensitive bicupin YhaK (pirin superfamily)